MPHKRARATHREGTSLASLAALVTDLEAAWNELHDAKPDGWFVGPPTYVERRRACLGRRAEPGRRRGYGSPLTRDRSSLAGQLVGRPIMTVARGCFEERRDRP